MLIELTPLLTTSEYADMCHQLSEHRGTVLCPFVFFDCPFPKLCQDITNEDWERLLGNKNPEQEEL